MLVDHHTMWLPGLSPEVSNEPVPLPVQKRPLTIEVREYVREKTRAIWPAPRKDLWDRAFTPVERYNMNLAAIKAVQDQKPGSKPDEATRDTLNLFTGWGALGKLFGYQPDWAARSKELSALLGEGYDSAQKAITTSFFTPPAIVRALWSCLERLGFKGGKVLEPSAGSGMFLGCMPESLAKQSQITAIEMDSSTAGVLSALYSPYGVKVLNQPFEKASLPAGYFDLVVTNVPFGDFGVPETRSVPFRDFRIHDYFIARAMEAVRPGGLVAVITSAGTMDKISTTVRDYLMTVGKLVTAIRLPGTAFKAFAGTEPTTDMLIFQRYEGSESSITPEHSGWGQVELVPAGHVCLGGNVIPHQGAMKVNEWFLAHPENVLGKMGYAAVNGFRASAVCEDDGRNLATSLAQLAGNLPEGVYTPMTPQQSIRAAKQFATVNDGTAMAPGTFLLIDGKVAVSEGYEKVILEDTLSSKAKDRIRGMIAIRDAVKALIKFQIESDDDIELARLQAVLNETYDRFVKVSGPLISPANARAFNGDPSAPLLLSLETSKDDVTVEKSEIFFRRTIGAVIKVTHCDSAEEALMVSLAEHGRVDIAFMAPLVRMDEDALADELACKGAIYLNPTTRSWEIADEYLSGDVKTKLSMAELAGDDFSANVSALREVIPADLSPADISARIGSTWIPLSDYEGFVVEEFGISANDCTVSYEPLTGSWDVKASAWRVKTDAAQKYGTTRVEPLGLLTQALNQQVPTVTDQDPKDPKKRVVNQVETIAAREKQADLKERFVAWVWENEERAARLAGHYNDVLNRVVDRKYDGKHLALPGFSNVYRLHTHQRDAIWRIVSSKRNTLLAHCVGAGKTLEMVCAGMELKRLGIATKPCYAVPNHMLIQFGTEFLRAYPAANILLASKDDLAGKNRRRFLSRIATNNWDAVIITHASFERIKMSDELVKSYMDEQIALLESGLKMERDRGNRMTVKQLERSKRDWEARIEKLANSKADAALSITFEDLGVDWLQIDESQTFKNLFRFSKMARVAGLPNSNAERAFDMYLKTQYVSRMHGFHGGVTFASGTPVSNSMAELWTVQRYLQPRSLEACGMGMFDAWAANFGESVAAIEIAPDGSGYRMNTRFCRFTNLPELMTMFREVADIKTAEMINLDVPAVSKEIRSAKPSDLLRSYVETLVKRAELVRNGSVHPKVDNMLAITNDGRKAALDMRLIAPGVPDYPDSKVNMCVKEVLEIYRQTAVERMAQVIFSDLGTPGGAGCFSIYTDIKEKLIAGGVPANEVAFAHDAHTDDAKAALSKAVCQGKIRVIIGSSQKLGVGTNMQEKLKVLHHLDAPWRPADIEQREGRLVRQGNTNTHVRILRWVTENSFDAYIWQTLETKSRFIAQIMCGDSGLRSAEDLELAALSYSEVKAIASGNPMVIEKAGIDAEVARMSIMKSQHDNQQWSNRRVVALIPERIEHLKRRVTAVQMDAQSIKGLGALCLVSGSQHITGRREIGDAIEQAVTQNLWRGSKEIVVGTIGDFTLTVSAAMLGTAYKLHLRGASTYVEDFSGRGVSAVNAIERLLNGLMGLESDLLAEIGRQERELRDLRLQLDVPFGKADRLKQLLDRQEEINASLGIKDGVVMATEAA